MFLGPVPTFLQGPAINDVANKIYGFCGVIFEEVEKVLSLALGSAEMYIGDPDCTISFHMCALNMTSVKVS